MKITNFYKFVRNEKTSHTQVFAQYFLNASLTAVTALGLSEYDASSLAHLSLGSLIHSSLQLL